MIEEKTKEFKEHRFLGKLNLEKGTPPSQFILYNHVSDVYYYGKGGYNFLSMRDTLIQYLKSLGFEIIAFYNISSGLTFAEKSMRQRFRELTTTAVKSTYGRRARARQQTQEKDSSAPTEQSEEPPTRPPDQPPRGSIENDLSAITNLLRQERQTGDGTVKSAVIIERIQNLVGQSPSMEERPIIDHIQSWSQITNDNVSILIADCEDLTNLPNEITGKNRSGVEIINVGLPNQEEINQLFISAEIKGTRINYDQKVDLIHRLSNSDCMEILDYFKSCRSQNMELNMRTLRELMTKTKDVWPDLLKEEKIQALNSKLKERVKGQDYAINKVIDTLRTVRHNIEDQINSGKTEEKPLAYFFFAGPTGVGKTEVFRVLSEELKSIRSLKINMPEYQEEHAVSRLLGAPPGYVGYGKGELGQFLYDNPAAIVLFDEFEKAHPKIWQNFLTMLEGSFTTGDGTKIDMSQTILFFTSNAGSEDLLRIEPEMSEGQQENIRQKNSEMVRNALRASGARPELIGRLLEAITPFNHLTRDVALEIIQLNLKKIADKLNGTGQIVEFDQSITYYLLDYYEREKASGARAIADRINGTLYREILAELQR